ncbi:MAG: PAS domain-containing protein, partial [Chloroflexota bacterium]
MADRAEHGIVVDAERLFQHLVEASPDAMLVIEKDIPQYLLINTAAEQLLGYTRSELLAIDALSILDPEDQDRLAEIIPQSEQTGSWRGELRLRRKDGAVVPCEATITCLDVGGHILYKGRFRDISRRNEAEAALRESEERLRQVTEHVDQVFWMSSLEKAEILYISPAYERIWGRSPESLLADPRSWIDAIHPDDRERVRLAALTRQASGAYDETYRIIRADGAIRWVHDRAFPVRNADGKVYRVLGVATDITEARL